MTLRFFVLVSFTASCLIQPVRASEAFVTPESLQVFDRYGQPLETTLVRSSWVSLPIRLDEMTPWLVLSTLAAEDRRFFDHEGVDVRAVVRAVWQNSRNGRVVSGGSTLTQQLVRLLEPRSKSMWGKLRESSQALWFERTHSKKDILEAYLNEVEYGNRTKGVEAAARHYFQSSAAALSLSQSALIAGLPQAPSRLDPRKYWERARHRQRTVLNRMLTWGWLDPEMYRAARLETLRVSEPSRSVEAPHFVQYVLRKGTPPVYRTTLASDIQDEFQRLLQNHLKQLAKSHVTNGAIVAIDNVSGDVLAWVGSADFWKKEISGQVDAVIAKRQPGSALKPFAYGLALEKGWTASSILMDEPLYSGSGYTPRNYDEQYHGPVRIREALPCSYNITAVRLLDQIGVPAFLRTLHEAGFDSLTADPETYGLGLVLGNGEVSLLELTNAYAALARGGLWKPVRVFESEPVRFPSRRFLSRRSSYLITDILSDNTARAPAFGLNSPFNLPFPFAAKTGTTKDYKDNWSVGYTPDWTIGVWVGNFDGKPMRRVTGITGAAPILRDAAFVMESRYGSRPFPVPSGIEDVEVCPVSGLLPSAECPAPMLEKFDRRHQPTRVCEKHTRSSELEATHDSVPAVIFPKPNDVFKIDPASPRPGQSIRFQSNVENTGAVEWFVNDQRIESEWWMLQPGRYRVQMRLKDRPEKPIRSVWFRVL